MGSIIFTNMHHSLITKITRNSGADKDNDHCEVKGKDRPFLQGDHSIQYNIVDDGRAKEKEEQLKPPSLKDELLCSTGAIVILYKGGDSNGSSKCKKINPGGSGVK